jgi:hypothetical protein
MCGLWRCWGRSAVRVLSWEKEVGIEAMVRRRGLEIGLLLRGSANCGMSDRLCPDLWPIYLLIYLFNTGEEMAEK